MQDCPVHGVGRQAVICSIQGEQKCWRDVTVIVMDYLPLVLGHVQLNYRSLLYSARAKW